MATTPSVMQLFPDISTPYPSIFSYYAHHSFSTARDEDDTCTKCGSRTILLTPGGVQWCICSLNAVDRQVSGLRRELHTAVDRIAEVESEHAAEIARSEKLRKDLRRSEDSTVRSYPIVAPPTDADKPQAVAQRSVADLERRLVVQVSTRNELNAKIQKLECRLLELQKEDRNLRDDLKAAETENGLLRDKGDRQTQEMTARLKGYESRLSFVESENDSLMSEVALYRGRCADLEMQIEEVAVALDVARTNYNNLEHQSEEEIARLEAGMRDRDMDIAAMQSTQAKLVDAEAQTSVESSAWQSARPIHVHATKLPDQHEYVELTELHVDSTELTCLNESSVSAEGRADQIAVEQLVDATEPPPTNDRADLLVDAPSPAIENLGTAEPPSTYSRTDLLVDATEPPPTNDRADLLVDAPSPAIENLGTAEPPSTYSRTDLLVDATEPPPANDCADLLKHPIAVERAGLPVDATEPPANEDLGMAEPSSTCSRADLLEHPVAVEQLVDSAQPTPTNGRAVLLEHEIAKLPEAPEHPVAVELTALRVDISLLVDVDLFRQAPAAGRSVSLRSLMPRRWTVDLPGDIVHALARLWVVGHSVQAERLLRDVTMVFHRVSAEESYYRSNTPPYPELQLISIDEGIAAPTSRVQRSFGVAHILLLLAIVYVGVVIFATRLVTPCLCEESAWNLANGGPPPNIVNMVWAAVDPRLSTSLPDTQFGTRNRVGRMSQSRAVSSSLSHSRGNTTSLSSPTTAKNLDEFPPSSLLTGIYL
ncbi:hypothetical protein GSI_05485 [Ganoderma sinense ZZ0214-1]|uniref:Uncharacterized protein n=1 Tax=Ganoderma sinense ZZ0214-1 TaxID=1077348 RepID=A0A2G8SEP8_9APHY|nr:hypothetical protein GSI_05485 [Ganoderma sinense ZZ0214-1]